MKLRLTPVIIVTMVSVAIMLAAETIFHWSVRGRVVDEPVGTHYGVILEPPRQKGKVWSAPVRTERGYKVMLRAVGSIPDSVVGRGRVMFRAAIEPPRDTHNPGEMAYGTWLIRHGFQGTAFCYQGRWQYDPDARGATEELSTWEALRIRFLQWRGQLAGQYAKHFDGAALGVLTAMTLGDRSHIDKATQEDFAAVGASHVLALSGLHLGILVSIYMLLCHRWLRRWRYGIVASAAGGAMLLLAFLMLTGMPTSLMRAALMLGMAMLCSMGERRGLSINNLCLAACVILIADPCSLFDMGFQLSFTCVAAILIATRAFPFPKAWIRATSNSVQLMDDARYRVARARLLAAPIGSGSTALSEYLPERLPLREWVRVKSLVWGGKLGRMLWDMSVVSLAAQIGAAPLLIYYFHSVPLYGFFLSFALIPLAYMILMGAVLFLVLPPLRAVMAVGLRHLVLALLAVVQGVGALPGNHIEVEWQNLPPFAIYSRFTTPELHCPEGQWRGGVCFTPYGRVARIDGRLPKGRPASPLPVDMLWICRGAKGDLQEWLKLYNPRVIILDATLTEYYHTLYRTQALQTKHPLHDIRREGAYVISE